MFITAKKEAQYINSDKKPLDTMLEYTGYSAEQITDIFAKLKNELIPLSKEIIANSKINDEIMNKPAIADDKGLCIDALDGQPGIYSSRYEETPLKRIEKVLKNMKNVPAEKRTAHFICSLALVKPDGELIFSTEGKCDGIIIDELKGTQGFGYDPIFYIPDLNKTMAELSMVEKNKISNRSDALNKFISWLGELG